MNLAVNISAHNLNSGTYYLTLSDGPSFGGSGQLLWDVNFNAQFRKFL